MPDGPSSPSSSSRAYSADAAQEFHETVDTFGKELDRRSRMIADTRDHEFVLKVDVEQACNQMRVPIQQKAVRFFRLLGPVMVGVGATEVLNALNSAKFEIPILFVLILALGVGFTAYSLSG